MKINKKVILPITDVLGLAVLDSQRLEYAISFLMLLSKKDFDFTDKNQDEEINKYMLNLSKKTLGILIEQLKKIVKIDDNFVKKLEEALDARNFLIHRFLDSQGEKLLTKNGRNEVLSLVKKKRKILYECYFFLDPFIKTLMNLKGFSAKFSFDEVSNEFEND